ncbi:hypothetical protein [Streptomyces chattanoogensis]|uniref:hypothetical protein n=1 Tax=Streptomyces chattanoogensis TaxID=66876 RepID=UPI000AB6BF3B|nr:hypothetical protein [Streptomyces chattanoogensis]
MSETPQLDPRKGSGETGPIPPLPERAPAAPSAWSQTVPATLPQHGDPAAGRGRGSARLWLIVGGAALAVAAIVGVVVAMSGGDGKNTASENSPAAPGGAKPPAPGAAEPAGKTYTKVPEGCELIKASTLARIAPGTECKPSQFDNATMAAMITRMPSWKTPFGSSGAFLDLDVNLSVSPGAKGMYDMHKKTALTALGKVRKVTDSRPLHDLGNEAHVVHAVDKAPMDLAEATVIVRAGNAEYTVGYSYDVQRSGMNQQQAEDAAIAAAHDVLGSLG